MLHFDASTPVHRKALELARQKQHVDVTIKNMQNLLTMLEQERTVLDAALNGLIKQTTSQVREKEKKKGGGGNGFNLCLKRLDLLALQVSPSLRNCALAPRCASLRLNAIWKRSRQLSCEKRRETCVSRIIEEEERKKKKKKKKIKKKQTKKLKKKKKKKKE